MGPALASNDTVQFIRGQGSDSTFDLMQKLDTAYNNTQGCLTTPSTGGSSDPNVLSSTCFGENTPNFGQENHDHDLAISMYPIGSSNGISMLTKYGQPSVTKIDYARSSRASRSGDNTGLRFIAYANDATPWGNFRTGTGDSGSPAAVVDNLTVSQLQNIFTICDPATSGENIRGTFDNWNDVGGQNAQIIVWTSQAGSGERASFDLFLTGDSSACIPPSKKDSNLTNGENVIFENDPSPIRHCADWLDAHNVSQTADTAALSCDANRDGTRDANAVQESIFHTGYGAWFSWPSQDPYGKGAGMDLGAIGGVFPTATTIHDGTYTAHRLVYNVYRSNSMTNPASVWTKDYISESGWICKVNTSHVDNPKTGENYGVESSAIIDSTGFDHLDVATVQNEANQNIQSKCRVSIPPP